MSDSVQFWSKNHHLFWPLRRPNHIRKDRMHWRKIREREDHVLGKPSPWCFSAFIDLQHPSLAIRQFNGTPRAFFGHPREPRHLIFDLAINRHLWRQKIYQQRIQREVTHFVANTSNFRLCGTARAKRSWSLFEIHLRCKCTMLFSINYCVTARGVLLWRIYTKHIL